MRSLFLAHILFSSIACGLDLAFPTDNRQLIEGTPDQFYMHVDRNFEGNRSTPWQGGSYGLVRNSYRVNKDLVIDTKFHEGIDIKPLQRDAKGNPLDVVKSIAAGQVVYVNALAGRSNYGKYIVIEHKWENSAVYSLYAHLANTDVTVGATVDKGSPIGLMGFTGEGINRQRAHLHLEVCLMLNGRYDQLTSEKSNPHGLYHGANLCGVDVARLLEENTKNHDLTLSQFLAAYPVYFKVLIPNAGLPDLAVRYPWMIRQIPTKSHLSWEIQFSQHGVPLSMQASDRPTEQPIITWVRASTNVPHALLTRHLLVGEGKTASLSADGRALMQLLNGIFPENTPKSPLKNNETTDSE